MRTLTYYAAVSLDGRISSPEHDFSAFQTEGDHMDLILGEYRDTVPKVALDALGLTADRSRFDTVLMGWNTYAAGFPQGVRNPYPHLRQFVFSRTRTASDAAPGIEVTSENPLDLARRLKSEPEGSGIWLCGGGQLAGALLPEIDRLVLKVAPALLGAGIPLVDGGYDPRHFRRTAVRPFESGVTVLEFERV